MRLMKLLRQTGRTQRMLAAAEEAAKTNRAIVIVCDTNSQTVEVTKRFKEYSNVQVFCYGGVQLTNYVNPVTLKAHDKSCVFVDHGVIESRFPDFVRHLHEYDEAMRLND